MSVTVTRDATAVFDRVYGVGSLGRVQTRCVFERTGTYQVTAAIEGSDSASLRVTADEEWLRRFGVFVGIESGGELTIAEWHAEASPT